jgi:hypothetical protein
MLMFGYINLKKAEQEKFIYRILPISRLERILKKNELGLLNPKKWEEEDPYENFLMNQDITLNSGKVVSFRETTKNLYGLCWTLNSNSDYAWKVYTRGLDKNEYAVQIKTKINRLHDEFEYLKEDPNLETFQLGKIDYIKWLQLKAKYEKRRTINPLELITNYSCFEKRFEYRHEKEIRLLLRYFNHQNPVLNLQFNLNNVCKTIMLDPRLKYNDYLNEQERIKEWGFEGSIYRSTLYTAPKLNLIYDKLEG